MEIQLAKRLRQRLERIWRRTRSCLDRSRYRKQANLCNKMMSDARRKYYADCINETSENPWTLWKTINNILHRAQSPSIPAFSDIKSLSESFSKFVMDKIKKIRINFTNDVHNMPVIESPTVKSRMTCFELATADEVRKLINPPSKTCDLDPIPTELLKSSFCWFQSHKWLIYLWFQEFFQTFLKHHMSCLYSKAIFIKRWHKKLQTSLKPKLCFENHRKSYSKSDSFTSWKKRSIKSVSFSLQEILFYWNGRTQSLKWHNFEFGRGKGHCTYSDRTVSPLIELYHQSLVNLVW